MLVLTLLVYLIVWLCAAQPNSLSLDGARQSKWVNRQYGNLLDGRLLSPFYRSAPPASVHGSLGFRASSEGALDQTTFAIRTQLTVG